VKFPIPACARRNDMSLIMHNIRYVSIDHSRSNQSTALVVGQRKKGSLKSFKWSLAPGWVHPHRFVLKNQLLRLLPPSPPARLEMIGRDGAPFIMLPPVAPSRFVEAPPPPRSGLAILAPAFIRLLKPPGPAAPPAAIFLDETFAASRRSLTAASCASNLM
jgi:hypothetical protein